MKRVDLNGISRAQSSPLQTLIYGVGLLMITTLGQAQNLVTNGDFAADLSSWNSPSGLVVWSAMDEFDAADSGSMMLSDFGEFGTTFTQCISPEPVGAHEYSLSYFVPVDVNTVFNDGISLLVTWFDGPNCTSTVLGGTSISSGVTVQGSWVRISDVLTAPLGADSVQIWPVMVGSGSSDFTSFIDNVFVGDRLFSDGFES